MFKVRLSSASGETKEYSTATLQYAKRYADLYKDDFGYTEIIRCTETEEQVIETFGERA